MRLERIWDIPTRLFHWSLVLLIAISFYTGLSGGFQEMNYHMISGYSILALVLFRILWGIFGGHYARFTTFVKGPVDVMVYLKQLNKDGSPYAGHNPLGALGIVAMLLVLFVQTGTGLFANDDILLEGPLVHLVSYDTSRSLTGFHKKNIWLIAALVTAHIAAILYHQFYRKERLMGAMLTGKKPLNETARQPSTLIRELLLGSFALAASASAVYVLITFV